MKVISKLKYCRKCKRPREKTIIIENILSQSPIAKARQRWGKGWKHERQEIKFRTYIIELSL